jgi:hypothetical protein
MKPYEKNDKDSEYYLNVFNQNQNQLQIKIGGKNR